MTNNCRTAKGSPLDICDSSLALRRSNFLVLYRPPNPWLISMDQYLHSTLSNDDEGKASLIDPYMELSRIERQHFRGRRNPTFRGAASDLDIPLCSQSIYPSILSLSLHSSVELVLFTCIRSISASSCVISKRWLPCSQAAIDFLLARAWKRLLNSGSVVIPLPIGLPLPRYFDRHSRSTTTLFQMFRRPSSML